MQVTPAGGHVAAQYQGEKGEGDLKDVEHACIVQYLGRRIAEASKSRFEGR